MKYKCLVLDFDDTLVRSTSEIHYPSFVRVVNLLRPGVKISLEEYNKYNFELGFVGLYKQILNFSDEEVMLEEDMWREYSKDIIPHMYPGIKEVIKKYEDMGGIITVISHNVKEKIVQTFIKNDLKEPKRVYGWDDKEYIKPNPKGIDTIVKDFGLTREDVLVLDDLNTGYELAKKAYVDFAYAGWGETKTDEVEEFMKEKADYYLSSVKEFEDLIIE